MGTSYRTRRRVASLTCLWTILSSKQVNSSRLPPLSSSFNFTSVFERLSVSFSLPFPLLLVSSRQRPPVPALVLCLDRRSYNGRVHSPIQDFGSLNPPSSSLHIPLPACYPGRSYHLDPSSIHQYIRLDEADPLKLPLAPPKMADPQLEIRRLELQLRILELQAQVAAASQSQQDTLAVSLIPSTSNSFRCLG